MCQPGHSSDGHSHGRSENFSTGYTYTYGVSCGSSETDGVTHFYTGLRGRARAAEVVQEMTKTLHQLAAEVPTKDFLWARRAVDASFDQILFGRAPE